MRLDGVKGVEVHIIARSVASDRIYERVIEMITPPNIALSAQFAQLEPVIKRALEKMDAERERQAQEKSA